MTRERWAQIGITTQFLIVVRTLSEIFWLRHVHGPFPNTLQVRIVRMANTLRPCGIALAISIFLSTLSWGQQQFGTVRFEPSDFKASGRIVPAELGHLAVPERHKQPRANTSNWLSCDFAVQQRILELRSFTSQADQETRGVIRRVVNGCRSSWQCGRSPT